MTRARQARLLARPLWHAGTWRLIPLVTLAVVGGSAALALAGAEPDRGVLAAAGAFLLAAVAGFALDDESAGTVAAVPAPPAFRVGLRLLGAYLLVAVCWATLLAFTDPSAVARPTLLLAVLVTVGLLAASFGGGQASAPALVAFLALAASLPDRWAVLENVPGSGARLVAVLTVAAALLVVRCSGDVKRRPPYRRFGTAAAGVTTGARRRPWCRRSGRSEESSA